MAEKDVLLTVTEGGTPLAKTIEYPKLNVLTRNEQRESWKRSLKDIEVQTQQRYMNAMMYPGDSDVQEQYQESLDGLKNLRNAHEKWLKAQS